MINIEQRFVGTGSFQDLCNRLSPQSQLEDIADVTANLVMFGVVQKAKKIKHTLQSGKVKYVLEILESGGPDGDRHVVLTLDRDFTGPDALEAYKQFRAIKGM